MSENGNFAPVERAGPYVNTEGIEIRKPKDLPGKDTSGLTYEADPNATGSQPVIVDAFETPVLYYAANVRYLEANKGKKECAIASELDGCEPFGTLCTPPASYSFKDNKLFTGFCTGGTCSPPAWDFAGVGGEADAHRLKDFGTGWGGDLTPGTVAAGDTADAFDLPANRHTFPYYILNKSAYDSSDGKVVTPYRPDSFILISAGLDGLYGTGDDVRNFSGD